jgi:hypothetical protein
VVEHHRQAVLWPRDQDLQVAAPAHRHRQVHGSLFISHVPIPVLTLPELLAVPRIIAGT